MISMLANLTLATVIGYGHDRFADRSLSDVLLLSSLVMVGSAIGALECLRREGETPMPEDRESC